MEGAVISRLAEAVKSAGFVVKKIEDVAYGSFDRPFSGEKYTGELTLRIRPAEDEEADAEKVRTRKEEEAAKNAPAAPATVEPMPDEEQKEVPF